MSALIDHKRLTREVKDKDFSTRTYMTAFEKRKTVVQFEDFLVARLNMSQQEVDNFTGSFGPWRRLLYQHFHNRLGYGAHQTNVGFFTQEWLNTGDFYRNIQMLSAGKDDAGRLMCMDAEYGDLNWWIRKLAIAYFPEVCECRGELVESSRVTIHLHGLTSDDLAMAAEEVGRLLREGFTSGMDQNECGGYSFS